MKFLKCLILLFPTLVFSQEFEISGSIGTKAIVSNENENPFWFHTNTNYEIGDLTNFAATGTLKTSLTFSSFKLNAGGTIYGRDGVEDAIQRRDLYVQFENSWLFATIGAKKQKEVFDGLSATNQNFLWSGNARPLPGILLEANNPIKISNTFEIDWGIAHYELNDERFVKGTHLHYKRLGLITHINESNKITARVQHYAQWGGNSPEFGPLKEGFSDFIKVFFAANSTEIGLDDEIKNAVGNHLGSYFLEYELKTLKGNFSLYHDHPFDDGSGTRFANFPDGLWGISFQPANKKIISRLVYEFIYTLNQSGISVGSGYDNYFNNNIYRSGWTYEGNIIGIPLMLRNTSKVDENSVAITSNMVRAHHLGLAANIKKLDLETKLTYVENLGRKANPNYDEVKNLYTYASLIYKTDKLGAFKIMGGIDFSNISSTLIGGGLEYSYQFK